jgi:hypothetical protein
VYASRVGARRKRHGWQGTTITHKQSAAPRKSRTQEFHLLSHLSQSPGLWWTIQDLNL